jgi:hypothetical protein
MAVLVLAAQAAQAVAAHIPVVLAVQEHQAKEMQGGLALVVLLLMALAVAAEQVQQVE